MDHGSPMRFRSPLTSLWKDKASVPVAAPPSLSHKELFPSRGSALASFSASHPRARDKENTGKWLAIPQPGQEEAFLDQGQT